MRLEQPGELNLFESGETAPRLLATSKVLEAEKGMCGSPRSLSQDFLLVWDQRQPKCPDIRTIPAFACASPGKKCAVIHNPGEAQSDFYRQIM